MSTARWQNIAGSKNFFITESIKYAPGEVEQEMIVWNTKDLLSNCTQMKINPVKSK